MSKGLSNWRAIGEGLLILNSYREKARANLDTMTISKYGIYCYLDPRVEISKADLEKLRLLGWVYDGGWEWYKEESAPMEG